MDSRLVIMLLIPLFVSVGLNAYLLSVKVDKSGKNVFATYDVSSFSQEYGFYQGNQIPHRDAYMPGAIFDGARTTAASSPQRWTLTADHPLPGQSGNYTDTVGWATPPLTSDVVIDGIVRVNVWVSSTASCALTCGSAFGSALAELDPNNNRIWNSAIFPGASPQRGQTLPSITALEQIAVPIQSHKAKAGDRIVFLFGIGSNSQTYTATVEFGGQSHFSSASVPEVGTSFNVSPYYFFAQASSNSYVNMNLTVNVIVPSDVANIYVKWQSPDWYSSSDEVIAYVTIAHTNRTGFQACPSPSCSSPAYFTELNANTKYTLELQVTEIQDAPFTTPKFPALTPAAFLLLLISIIIPFGVAKRRFPRTPNEE